MNSDNLIGAYAALLAAAGITFWQGEPAGYEVFTALGVMLTAVTAASAMWHRWRQRRQRRTAPA